MYSNNDFRYYKGGSYLAHYGKKGMKWHKHLKAKEKFTSDRQGWTDSRLAFTEKEYKKRKTLAKANYDTAKRNLDARREAIQASRKQTDPFDKGWELGGAEYRRREAEKFIHNASKESNTAAAYKKENMALKKKQDSYRKQASELRKKRKVANKITGKNTSWLRKQLPARHPGRKTSFKFYKKEPRIIK